MVQGTFSLEDLSAELDRSVLDAEEFIRRFKDLAARLDAPDTDQTLRTVEATESLISSYRDIARRVAQDVKKGSMSPEEQSALLGLIAWATRQIRRATLVLKRQISRLEDMLGKEIESLSVS
jgi:hypothetical protein